MIVDTTTTPHYGIQMATAIQDGRQVERASSKNKNSYVIKLSDTWESIAKKFSISTEQLKRENNAQYTNKQPTVGASILVPLNTLPHLISDNSSKKDKTGGAIGSLQQAVSKDSLAASLSTLANKPGADRMAPKNGIVDNPLRDRYMKASVVGGDDDTPQTTDTVSVGKSIVSGLANTAVNAEIQEKISSLKESGKDYPLISNLKISFNPTVTDRDWLKDWSIDTMGPIAKWKDTRLNVQLGARHQYQRAYGDIGLVLRHLLANNSYMIGGNAFIDTDFTGGNTRYGLGAEFFGPYMKSSINVYQRITGWRVSPFNFMREERIANGYDLNLTGYLPSWPSISVTGTYFQYFGDQVDVIHNGVFLKNPNGYQAMFAWKPMPLYQANIGFVQSSGQTQSTLGIGLNYVLEQTLAQQLKPTTASDVNDVSAFWNDLVVRNYTPVLEERDRKFPIYFPSGPSYLKTLNESTSLSYAPNTQGGYGLITYSLAGADVSKFQFNSVTRVLSWASGFLPIYATPQDSGGINLYQVSITANDNYGNSAVQAVGIKIVPAATVLPSATDLSMKKPGVNVLGDDVPRIGNILKIEYKFVPGKDGQEEDVKETKFQWYLDGKLIEGVTGREFLVPNKDLGKTLSFGVRVAAHNKSNPSEIEYAKDFAIKDLGVIFTTINTPTQVGILINGAPIGTQSPIITTNATGGPIIGTVLTADVSCFIGSGSACIGGGALTYQWQRWASLSDETFVNIDQATQASYSPTFIDLGRKIRVSVSFPNA
jgi:LysM repeat protein